MNALHAVVSRVRSHFSSRSLLIVVSLLLAFPMIVAIAKTQVDGSPAGPGLDPAVGASRSDLQADKASGEIASATNAAHDPPDSGSIGCGCAEPCSVMFPAPVRSTTPVLVARARKRTSSRERVPLTASR